MRKNEISVSVVLCSYNGAAYIKEQIDSILNQSYPVTELIIQDDGSTDGTWNLLTQYEMDPKVLIFRNEESLGFNANFTTAVMKAKGDYIACSDQDDIWKENKIEELVAHIDDNILLFHDSILFKTDIQHPLGMKNLSNQNLNELFLLMKPYIPGHQIFFSRKVLPGLARIISLEPNVSFDTIIVLIARVMGKIGYLEKGLVYWRRHPKACTYIESPKKIGKREGFISVLIDILPFKDKTSRLIVDKLKTGKILSACFICLKGRKTLFPGESIYSSLLKTFFLPFYFNRDCSGFIIKEKFR